MILYANVAGLQRFAGTSIGVTIAGNGEGIGPLAFLRFDEGDEWTALAIQI